MRTPLWFLDTLAYVHVDAEASGGALALVESVAPKGDMPPLHVHHRDDEAFYVIDGRLTLFVADRDPVELGPGEAVLAPREIPHVYRVESERARWLVALTPAGFDEFVRAVAEPAGYDDLPPEGRAHDIERVNAAAARQGIEILGPPGVTP